MQKTIHLKEIERSIKSTRNKSKHMVVLLEHFVP